MAQRDRGMAANILRQQQPAGVNQRLDELRDGSGCSHQLVSGRPLPGSLAGRVNVHQGTEYLRQSSIEIQALRLSKLFEEFVGPSANRASQSAHDVVRPQGEAVL